MQNVFICLNDKRVYYLSCLYPIKWTEYISLAKIYKSIEEARLDLNTRYRQLLYDSDINGYSIHNIDLCIINTNNNEIKHVKYL